MSFRTHRALAQLIRWLVCVTASVSIATCAFSSLRSSHRDEGPLSVHEILENGSKFEGKLVSVHGIAISGVGLLWAGAYRLRDTTGNAELFVLSETGVPPLRREATATGVFKQGLTIGQYRYGALVPQGWCDLERAKNSVSQIIAALCTTG